MHQLNPTITLGKLFSHCVLGFLTVSIKEFLNKRMVNSVVTNRSSKQCQKTICTSEWIDSEEDAIGRFKEHRDGFMVEQHGMFQALFSFCCLLVCAAGFHTYLFLPLNSVTFFSSSIVK